MPSRRRSRTQPRSTRRLPRPALLSRLALRLPRRPPTILPRRPRRAPSRARKRARSTAQRPIRRRRRRRKGLGRQGGSAVRAVTRVWSLDRCAAAGAPVAQEPSAVRAERRIRFGPRPTVRTAHLVVAIRTDDGFELVVAWAAANRQRRARIAAHRRDGLASVPRLELHVVRVRQLAGRAIEFDLS